MGLISISQPSWSCCVLLVISAHAIVQFYRLSDFVVVFFCVLRHKAMVLFEHMGKWTLVFDLMLTLMPVVSIVMQASEANPSAAVEDIKVCLCLDFDVVWPLGRTMLVDLITRERSSAPSILQPHLLYQCPGGFGRNNFLVGLYNLQILLNRGESFSAPLSQLNHAQSTQQKSGSCSIGNIILHSLPNNFQMVTTLG